MVDRARLGEPVKELWTSDDISPPEWLLKPLLYKGLPTIVFGEKAVSKSILALVAYTCLLLPWTDNPLGWTAPTRSIKTLLADYEVDYDVAHYNIKRLQEGMGLPAFPLYYRRCAIPLADDIEQLQRHMGDIGAEAIIVDSMGPAVGGDLKDPGVALRFTSALRQLRCGALIIGQTSKDRESKVKSVFGSTFFEYYARNIFELRKEQEEGEDEFDVALYNTYHNLGPRVKSQGFHLCFNGTGIHMESKAITVPELIARMGAAAQIRKALQRGKYKAKELAEKLGLHINTVSQALKRMADKGIVVKNPEGYWELPTGEEQEEN